eukprot:g11797.t1
MCADSNSAPCLGAAATTTPTPEPADATPEPTPEVTPDPDTPAAGFSCTGDAGIAQGDICCEASCGTCGGSGCSGRGNGQLSCCTANIRAVGATCSETGAAPCIIDGDVTVTPTPEPADATPEPTPEVTPDPDTPAAGFSCTGDAGIAQGDICCEASCGTCGGSGCSGRGNGQLSCCTANIRDVGATCSETGAAPCIIDGDVTVTPTPEPADATPEPTPEVTPDPDTPATGFSCTGDAGIAQGDICCEASCGTCGGSGCSGRGNGQLSCCTTNIRDVGATCSETGAAPCIIDGDVIVTPEPTPEVTPEPETPTTGFSCTGDAGVVQGDICCEASCGTCGGSGCSGRGNGQLSCCTTNIRDVGVTCSETGAAPCIIDGDTTNPVGPPTPSFQEVGCYNDMTEPDRIMVDTISSSSMTVEVCQVHCAGSAYFGVQYAIECWCSGTDSTDYPYDVHGESPACLAPCSGDSSQVCGGTWAMTVYQNV